MFFNNTCTCIDIGTSAIKIVHFKFSKDDLIILNSDIINLTKGVIKNGEILDHSNVANKINKLLNKMKIKPKNITTAVSSHNLLIRNIDIPNLKEKNIKEALKWETDEELPYPVNTAVLDYVLVDKNDDLSKYMVTAIKQKNVDSFIKVFKKINLNPDTINVQPMALISILKYQEKIEGNVAVIDIGFSGTQVTIGSCKKILLSRTIDIGSDDFTKIIAGNFSVEYKKAEKEKKKFGINNDQNYNSDNLSLELNNSFQEDNIQKKLNSLYQEINRSFDYFSVKNQGEEISEIYLTGGGAKLKGLKEFFENKIGRKLFRLNPIRNITIKQKSNAFINEFKDIFAVAVGLGISEVMSNES